MPVEFTDDNFKDKVINNSDQLTVVDFWAEWCGPCRMVSPIIEELANEYDNGDVQIGKLNVDDNPDVAQKQGIRSIPAILFFKQIGAASKAQLKEKIDKHVN